MKSGENGLIGPGDNDYGRDSKFKGLKIVHELTPELSEKLWNQIQQKLHDQRASKDMVLHYLKQLKAQIGKIQKIKWSEYFLNTGIPSTPEKIYKLGIDRCVEAIDKKIEKVKKL